MFSVSKISGCSNSNNKNNKWKHKMVMEQFSAYNVCLQTIEVDQKATVFN